CQNDCILHSAAHLLGADCKVAFFHNQIERFVKVGAVQRREIEVQLVGFHRRIETEVAQSVPFNGSFELFELIGAEQLHSARHERAKPLCPWLLFHASINQSNSNCLRWVMKFLVYGSEQRSQEGVACIG